MEVRKFSKVLGKEITITNLPFGFTKVSDENIDFFLPFDLKFRLFKLRLPDNKWLTRSFSNPIRAFEELSRYIDIADIYYTTSEFFSPSEVKKKRRPRVRKGIRKGVKDTTYLWASHRFYRADCVFDFDAKEIKDKKKLFPVVAALWNYLQETYKAEKLLLLETGRGYHIHWLDFWEKQMVPFFSNIDPHHLEFPGNKEYLVSKVRKALIYDLMLNGFSQKLEKGEKILYKCLFDKPITEDTRRIIRLGGSIHQKTKEKVKWFYTLDEYAESRIKLRLDSEKANIPPRLDTAKSPPSMRLSNPTGVGQNSAKGELVEMLTQASVSQEPSPLNFSKEVING